MKVLILFAVCVAGASAFIPGNPPTCNADNVEGGSILMPHERYCQQFYSCDGDLNAVAQACSDGQLFAYTFGTTTCVEPTNPNAFCPNWGCSVNGDIGNRYPDNCCDKYWECTSDLVYERFNCPNNQVFDSVAEVCVFPGPNTCTPSQLCIDLIVPNTNPRCHDFANDNGDPCKYKTVYAGTTWDNRPCPDGAAFSATECNCAVFQATCNNARITPAQAQANKAFDTECRISRRVDFTFLPLATFSEKINLELRHYFRTSGVTTSNSEAVFQTGNTETFIYDYFFNDNELFAPLAIAMTFKFDVIPQVGNTVSLLSNDFSLDPNNPLCNPSTMEISARYEGLSNAQRVWTFTISATGTNGLSASASNSLNGDAQDYFRIVFTFNGQIAATVQNRGINNNNIGNNLNTINLGSNQALGAKLRPNKCGFVIGRGLTGRIREFNVYEGCGDFSRII